jgi:hypothetical protein
LLLAGAASKLSFELVLSGVLPGVMSEAFLAEWRRGLGRGFEVVEGALGAGVSEAFVRPMVNTWVSLNSFCVRCFVFDLTFKKMNISQVLTCTASVCLQHTDAYRSFNPPLHCYWCILDAILLLLEELWSDFSFS